MALVALIAFLGAGLKLVNDSRKRHKKKAEQAKREVEFMRDVEDVESQLDQEFSRRSEAAKEKMRDGKVPDSLSDPNKF